MYGDFSEEAKAVWNFARCQRPDGTFYGSPSENCRKGTKTSDKTDARSGYKARKHEKGKGGTLEVEEKGTIGKNTTFDPDFFRSRIEEIEESSLVKGLSGKRKEQVIKGTRKALEEKLEKAQRNREFLDNLKQNSQEGTKITAESELVVMSFKTKSGDLVTTEFSPFNGYVFRVNGEVDAGSVKDQKAQREVASAVRRQYDALVQSLPEGSIVKTFAHTEDGKGAQRQRLYERVGFSKATPGEEIFSIKGKDGTMFPLPASDESLDRLMEQEEDPNYVFFAEGGVETTHMERTWLGIVFG